MKDYFSFVFNKVRVKLFFIDQIILLGVIFLSYIIRFIYDKREFSMILMEKSLVVYLILFPLIFIAFYIFGVYERWEVGNFSKTAVKLLFSLVFVSFLAGFIFYFIPYYFVGRVVFVLLFSLYFIILIFQRFLFFLNFEKSITKQKVYFLGLSDGERKAISDEFENNSFFIFEFIPDNKVGNFINEIEKNLSQEEIIVLSFEKNIVKEHIEKILELRFKGFFVYDFENFYISITGKVFDISFKNVWKIVYEKSYLTSITSYYKLKRVFDLLVASFLLILFAPLFLITAFLIKITSKGPIFFIQERLGWYKKPFRLIKFRTMIVDAEKQTGPKWAGKDDPRITKVGKFLRRTRIDEIPQLINVLKGDMSLVGNRPIRKYFADQLKKEIPFYDLRFFIKPGLTGWSQVKMGYINTVEQQLEKFKYELFYIKNMSLLLDLIILIKTIKTVLNFKGN